MFCMNLLVSVREKCNTISFGSAKSLKKRPKPTAVGPKTFPGLWDP